MNGVEVTVTNTTAHTADTPQLLLEHHLKELRLPTILREYDKVARQCAGEQLDYQRYLLRMTELELLDRERRATERRIRQAKFPVNAQEEAPEENIEMQHGSPLDPVAQAEQAFNFSAKTWNFMTEPGPLGTGDVAQSFAGGQYSEYVVPEGGMGFEAHRVWGGSAPENGRYYSPDPQVGGIQSIMDLALLPEHGNSAQSVSSVYLPPGTVTYVGRIASQGGFWLGGGIQIFVPNPPKP